MIIKQIKNPVDQSIIAYFAVSVPGDLIEDNTMV